MPVKEIKVTVKVDDKSPARAKDKEKMLMAFSALDAGHQERMTKIMLNPKALRAIEENWAILESTYN